MALLTLLSHTLFHADHNHDYSSERLAPAVVAPPCPAEPAHTYNLDITARGIQPHQVTAQRCDKLVITNKTNAIAIPALGQHEHHIEYPGFTEKALKNGQSTAFVLSESGTFPVHDHLDDELRATIVVNK